MGEERGGGGGKEGKKRPWAWQDKGAAGEDGAREGGQGEKRALEGEDERGGKRRGLGGEGEGLVGGAQGDQEPSVCGNGDGGGGERKEAEQALEPISMLTPAESECMPHTLWHVKHDLAYLQPHMEPPMPL